MTDLETHEHPDVEERDLASRTGPIVALVFLTISTLCFEGLGVLAMIVFDLEPVFRTRPDPMPAEVVIFVAIGVGLPTLLFGLRILRARPRGFATLVTWAGVVVGAISTIAAPAALVGLFWSFLSDRGGASVGTFLILILAVSSVTLVIAAVPILLIAWQSRTSPVGLVGSYVGIAILIVLVIIHPW